MWNLRHFNENLESRIPKNFYPYCECSEEYKVESEVFSIDQRSFMKGFKDEEDAPTPCLYHHTYSNHQIREVFCSSSVGARGNTTDCLDNVHDRSMIGRGTGQGFRRGGVGTCEGFRHGEVGTGLGFRCGGVRTGEGEGAVAQMSEAIRNFDLLEHIISSHKHAKETNNTTLNTDTDDEMEDYYENHKQWPDN